MKRARSPVRRPGNRQRPAGGRRLAALLGLLGAAALALLLTQGWRERLLRESAQFRSQVREAQSSAAAGRARDEEANRLAQELSLHPADPEARLRLAELRWGQAGPRAALAVLDQAPRPFTDPT